MAVYYAAVYTIGWPPLAITLRALKVLLLYVPGWYAICQIVARQVATIVGLRRLFRRFEVAAQPLHPDRCGGLRAINAYAVRFTYVIAAAGLAVGLIAYVTLRREGALAPDVLLWIAVYVALALVCFFLPPWTAHAAMAEAKHKLLRDISAQFQRAYATMTAHLAGDPGELQATIDRIQSLHALYQLADTFPVWPFDTATLRRFVAIVSAPLAPLAIELAVSLVASLLRASS
jgi:hypothetical protein